MTATPQTEPIEIATLAGGCFWCLEAVFDRLAGVQQVVSGYMGGRVDEPTYKQICKGDTGHAEVVQISFNPTVISFGELLEVFFAIHDPTTPDRQGNDVGTQYRSAIFFHNPVQEQSARQMVTALTAEQVFPEAIVTQIVPAETFWPAEDYHQGYFEANPNQPYCAAVVAPKVRKVIAKYAERLKQ
ncbi:peptide-methionine (S)-S-oxide reductase MsrA [Chitinimonas koreensis]|uniref:peptide-methionine (S)-S-oxide reductase MsrA n=1 Tax=Chitinimonas koreensis TaxID=356302 RepID=UPI00041FF3D9|nr:peptide-methionine (S)-S-oxide reductase MsrA [Chitinimonas koreensis]QNM94682.1 peptide-methionine (S)-S-oxide reductase MsrA [Chitinimonas koreensis]